MTDSVNSRIGHKIHWRTGANDQVSSSMIAFVNKVMRDFYTRFECGSFTPEEL